MKQKDPILAGVIGWPIGHSLSPLIHTIWAARAGIEGYYVPIAIAPNFEDFACAMDSLIKLGFKGVNVTLPHKEHALRYAAGASDAATKARAANMLTFRSEGAFAENSDIEGFSNLLEGCFGATSQKETALILGAGGAARGVTIAIKACGFTKIYIANRTHEKAQALASEFQLTPVTWECRNDALGDVDLVVNTTSLGMTGQPPLEIITEQLPPQAVVADIVYAPLETKLLEAARSRGCKTASGLMMLMHQAAPGFRAWFGGAASMDSELRNALEGELARRGNK